MQGRDPLADRPADRVGALVTEGMLRGRIEFDDQTGFIDRDNAIQSGCRDRGVEDLACMQRRASPKYARLSPVVRRDSLANRRVALTARGGKLFLGRADCFARPAQLFHRSFAENQSGNIAMRLSDR